MPCKMKMMSNHIDPRPLAKRTAFVPGDTIDSLSVRQSVTVNLAESPLTWLHARGHLTERQLFAGEKLRCDFEASALQPQVTMRWELGPRDHHKRSATAGLNPTERMIAAKARFDAALAAMGPDLCDIAWRVICAGEALPVAEREMAWPMRSGKLVLRIALDRLAAYYRVPSWLRLTQR